MLLERGGVGDREPAQAVRFRRFVEVGWAAVGQQGQGIYLADGAGDFQRE
jgi:hypothetical protein